MKVITKMQQGPLVLTQKESRLIDMWRDLGDGQEAMYLMMEKMLNRMTPRHKAPVLRLVTSRT